MATLVLWVGHADAGRKRVVVLDFEGPKAEKFHRDVVKLIKKSHTVIKAEKWNAAADELDAGKLTEKNVKKVAKKLKVDAVISGKVDKRRDEYIIKLKLRAGTTGELTGNSVQTKADGPRLDGQAQRDIKDELIAIIDELESNRGGGGGDEEEEDEPKKSGFSKKSQMTSDEDEPKKKKKIDEEKAALSTKKSSEDEDDEEDKPKKRAKSSDEDEDAPRKRKAARDDEGGEEEDSIEEEVEVSDVDTALRLSPARRAIDVALGLSFTARRLQFTYAGDLGRPPPGYRQSVPVAGALFDATFYPMAFGGKNKGIISGIGLNVMYDQVLVINSQKRYLDGQSEQQVANLETKESRFAIGAVLRYPLGKGPKAPVVGGSLSYEKQKFLVAQELPNMMPTDIPNVAYTMFTPAAFIRFPALPKIIINADVAFHAITNTGDIQTRTQYGYSTVSGFEFSAGADYMITSRIFARGSVRYQSIGFKFKGDPMSQTNTRDSDPEQDVTGAKDTYFGGTATIGYVY